MNVYGQNNRSPSRAWFLIPILGIVAVLAIATVAFFFYRPAMPVAYPWYGWWWFPFPFFFIFPIIFLVFFGLRWIFWGGWWGGWGRGWYYGPHGDPALEILKERFARGELTKEQFDQMVKDLEQH